VQPLHTIAEIRTAEQVLLDALPEGALMARAATGLAVTCARLLRERCGRLVGASVLAVVGAGNNGGDALFAAAALTRRGVRVVAVLLDPDRAHPAGLAALRRARGRIAPAAELAALAAHADLVLDGIVGIGATGALHGPAAAAVRILNEHARFVVAVDLPSASPACSSTPVRARPGWSRSSTSGSGRTCPARRRPWSTTPIWQRCRNRIGRARSTPAGCSACTRAPRVTPVPRCCRRRGRWPGR
jgi:NAD(P)H-hydrate repair Nnr-like enzyme with NAD(P)H-hydrate epimerase domain